MIQMNQRLCTYVLAGLFLGLAVKTEAAPPEIIVQPQSQTNITGSNATFSVTATGTAPLSYQWLSFNFPLTNGFDPKGELVIGADTSTLVISNLTRIAPGPTPEITPYSVIVSNAEGAVTSNIAQSYVLDYIQAQVLAYQPGDPPIILPAGQYYENVLIDKDVVIQGAGAGLTVVHGVQFLTGLPVFRVSTNVTVTLRDLSMNGEKEQRAGSGLRNEGILTLENVIVENSSDFDGAGIFNLGTLSASNVVVQNNRALMTGGGILNFGNLFLTNSLVLSNQVTAVEFDGTGAGIFNDGFLILDTSTVSGNAGRSWLGGGVLGGGVFSTSSLIVNRCTFFNNAAGNGGAGIDGGNGALFITNSTISGNRGLGVNGGNGVIQNCTISSNSTGLASLCKVGGTVVFGNHKDCQGGMYSLGYNLIGDLQDSIITGILTGNIIGQDPLLGPLQDNGGPTFTHALLTGSPAINAGSPFDILPVDQRGFIRPVDGTGDSVFLPDIGAFEAQPPTAVVTSLGDSGPGSLRNALETAAPGATINFAVAGTIVLTSGPLVIDRNVEVVGPCEKRLTIDAHNSGVGLVVSNGVQAGVSGITISGAINNARPPEGNGGGIRNFGNLTLTRVAVVGNEATGLGGGIYNNGRLTLNQCLVSQNNAAFGGGIGDDAFDRLTINGSTISSNNAISPEESSGGGIYKLHDVGLLTDATISGNGTDEGNGGGIATFCYMRFESCTLASNRAFAIKFPSLGNGGGLFIGAGGFVDLRNTMIAGNSATGHGPDCYGTVFSQGYNLIQNTSGCSIAGVLIGNITGLDPKLGPLADNGGPTPTHALLTGSPAIDAGSPYDFPPTDQRGVARPQDGNGDGIAITDIGAYEKETVIPGSVPGNIIVTNLADSGPGTLREALVMAASGAKITFGVQGTIGVSSSLEITRNVQIAGPGVDKLALTGYSPVFIIGSNVTASLSDLTITNAYRSGFEPPPFGGGAVRSSGNLTMTRCVIARCGSDFGYGGAIFSSGNLTVSQCSISNNLIESAGGIADLGSGRLIVDRCTVNNNRASHGGNFEADGGGIAKASGLMWISNTTVSGNAVIAGNGGGLATGSAYVFMDGCTIVSNSASSIFAEFGRGGGIYKLDTGTIQIKNTILAGNSASTTFITNSNFGPDCFGWLYSEGWNLIQNPTNCTLAGVLTGNIIGADPRLGPLEDNGGPTLTHALLEGSPAIDTGSPYSFLSIDERGVSRPQDGNGDGVALPDIGAYEKLTPMPPCFANIDSIAVQSEVRVTAFGAPGELYTIQSAESLNSPQWVTFSAAAARPTGLLKFIDTRDRSQKSRFYRIIRVPNP